MDEATQETPTANEPTVKTEEVIENENKETKPTEHETERREEDTRSVDQNEESIEDDGNSVKSGSECSDRSRSDSEEDDASVVLEREEGDGQESAPNRKVDDDEDKRNPQYIPKRGTFYEHDDRTAVEEGEEAEKPEGERVAETVDGASKKKVWSEKEGSKWSHDRFNDQEQAPKSRTELISTYGYDIRNEEGPPRARRRRRYGRGPNKYTRNWEDEDAYGKPTNVVTKPNPRKPRSKKQEEFPPLGGSRNQSKSSDRTDTSGGGDTVDPPTDDKPIDEPEVENKDMGQSERASGNAARLVSGGGKKNEGRGNNENGEAKQQQQHKPPLQQRDQQREPMRRDNRNNKNTPRSRPDDHHPPQPQQQRGQGTNSRGITRTRGFKSGGRTGDSNRNRNHKNQNQQQEEGYTDYILSQNFTNKSMSQQQQQQQQQQGAQDLDKDVANMNIQDGGYNNSRGSGKFVGGGSRQTSVPPRLQAEQRGSKRYSSLRQRSLPETAAPAFGQHTGYYQAEFGQQNQQQQQSNQPGLLPHPTPSIHSQVPANNTPQLITVAPTNQGIAPLPHQGPPANGAPPLMQAPPPQYAQPYAQAPPAFLPAGVPAPAFIPQQAPPPQIINYAQPPPQFTQAAGYTNFQHQQFNPVNQAQPAELYQPQGGITYYSTQNQQVVPRIAQKRPKAAIPIVPPPEHKEPRGRGRLNQGEDSPVGGRPTTPADMYMDQKQQQQQTTDTTLTNNPVQYQNEAPIVVQQ